MLLICGDIHFPLDAATVSNKCIPFIERLTREDILIICGDLGVIWYSNMSSRDSRDQAGLNFFSALPMTVVFVDGNHENFPVLRTFPKVLRFNEVCHQLTENLFWLQRGSIYTLAGLQVLAMGGADSHDRAQRTQGLSWWPDEQIRVEDIECGAENLKQCNNRVDLIVTHTPPSMGIKAINAAYEGYIFGGEYLDTPSSTLLDRIAVQTPEVPWYCGHLHDNYEVIMPNKSPLTVLYRNVICIK